MDELKGSVIVYSRIGCLPYLDIQLDVFPKVEEQLCELVGCGQVQTPQIFFNTVRVAGYKDLRRLASSADAWSQILEMLEKHEKEESELDGTNSPERSNEEEEQDMSNDSKTIDDETGASEEPSKVDESLIPDDYQNLVRIFRRANLLRDGSARDNQSHRNSFKGEDFITFIMRERHVKRSEALELGQILIDKHFGPRMARDNPTGGLMFSTEHFYVMQDEDSNAPLNVVSIPNLTEEDLTIHAGEMNDRLCTVLKRLYDQILSPDKQLVFYDRLEDNNDFRVYLALASDFPRINLETATSHERTALFINIYNIMLVHIVYKFGIHSNIWMKRKYFNSTYYFIARHRYSLQSIYNGILRGNRKGLGMLWVGESILKPFGKLDPRRKHIIHDGNPLVHFALNAYALSSPKIRVYSAQDLTSDLAENARDYLEKREENLWYDTKKQIIMLSKFFKWFALDFGQINDQVIEWIIDLLSEEGQTRENLAKIYLSGQYTINYLPFNFDSNIIKENCEI